MKTSYRALAILFLLLTLSLSNASASHFIIIDNETGCILQEQGANDKFPVGSLTKIAVAITLLDWIKVSGNSLDAVAEVPTPAAPQGQGNPLGLQAGDRVTLRDLLYLTLLPSDSEAALTIANYVGLKLPNPQQLDGVGNFVAHMNALARELEMKRTLFLNSHGLPVVGNGEQPYSCAADLARLTRYGYSKPGLAFYVAQKSRDIHIQRGNKTLGATINNTNNLLGVNGIDGVKTARLPSVGESIVLTSARDPEVKKEGNTVYTTPRRIIVVILGSNNRATEGTALNQHGWDLYYAWAGRGRPTRSSRFL
ncbi:MAG: serine hydrolase [Chthoniobacterales bacterium]|nr:serine hydrolase [Chthoniobacterales bacterium]